VSSAAQSPLPAAGGPAGYALSRPQGKCSVCAGDIAEGDKFTAAVRETAAGLERIDLDSACWEAFDKSALLAYWRMAMPSAHGPAKPRVFVDDAVLCDLFDRLADTPADEPAKINFRFVLGLVLMRKRLLAYESTHVENGREFWTVRLKGRDELIDLQNPRLDEEQVAQVSTQLGQILSGEPA
jgi:hypothetical protein